MGYTLIRYDSEPEEIFRRVIDSMGFSKTIEEMKRAFSQTEREFKDLHFDYLLGKIPSKKYWIKWNSTVLKHLRLPDNESLGKQIQDKWFDYFKWDAYPDTLKTLKCLQQMRIKTGLVTTAYEEEIEIILGGANLQKDYFDTIIGADTLDYIKPHPKVFTHALDRLVVRPDEALFVGDLIEVDYKPAEAIGIRAVLIQRKDSSDRIGEDLRIIESLEEIFNYIN